MDGGTTELLTSLYRNAHPFINYSKFEVGSWEDLYFEERRTTKADILQHIASRRKNKHSSRIKRSSLAGKKGVMYVSLDGGGGGESCPSLADSAAVSLSQMAFLSMSVSIFSVGKNDMGILVNTGLWRNEIIIMTYLFSRKYCQQSQQQ